jgi:hypothetical protein
MPLGPVSTAAAAFTFPALVFFGCCFLPMVHSSFCKMACKILGVRQVLMICGAAARHGN